MITEQSLASSLTEEQIDAAIDAYDKAWCSTDRGRDNKEHALRQAIAAALAMQGPQTNVVAWVRKHPDTGALSGDWLWNDNIEQCRKDSGVWFPLGFIPATQPAREDHECTYENGDGICRECAELARNANPKTIKEGGYFVFDPAGPHVEFYNTDAERDAAHRDAINEYRLEARQDQEWSSEVVGIVSGIVTHTTEERKVEEDSYEYDPRCVVVREKNMPIVELMEQYRQDGFNFDDIEGVKRCAMRYVQTMPDSQVRTLLHTLAIQSEPSGDSWGRYPVVKILSPAEHWKFTSQNSVMYNFSSAGLVTCVRGILKEFQTQDVEARFIAEYGHRLAQLLNIESFDIADRDAQIMTLLKGNK